MECQAMVRRKIERDAVCAADRIVCLSNYMKEEVQNRYDPDPQQLEVIPGGVDTGRFSPISSGSKQFLRDKFEISQNRFVILTIRGLIPRTGVDNLIRAYAELAGTHPDTELHIGGDGPEKEHLQRLSSDLGISDRVRMLGYIPENKLANRYRSCDLFVLPTRSLEGFGLVTLEALACGIPVLATPVGGIPEVLKPFSTDLVVDSPSPDDIQRGLEMVLTERTRFKELGKQGKTFTRNQYQWDRHVEALINLFP